MRDHMPDTHTVWWREEFREGRTLSGSQGRWVSEKQLETRSPGSWRQGWGVISPIPQERKLRLRKET